MLPRVSIIIIIMIIIINSGVAMQAWNTGALDPLEFANARKFIQPYKLCLCLSFCRVSSKLNCQSHQNPLLDDFVTTNFGTRAPRARAPLPEQNSGDATE